MLLVPTSLSYLKRPFRPLYANTQATPKGVTLDPNWDHSVDIYPGFGVIKQTGQQVTLPSASTDKIYGFANFYEAPTLGIPEITRQGISATSVWVFGPDAEFLVDSPAFDASLSWVDGDLVTVYYTGAKRGQLARSGTANTTTAVCARVLQVNSSTTLTIGGLYGTV